MENLEDSVLMLWKYIRMYIMQR